MAVGLLRHQPPAPRNTGRYIAQHTARDAAIFYLHVSYGTITAVLTPDGILRVA